MIDCRLRQYFAGDETYYGSVRFETAAYQDDILKPSEGVSSAQGGMTRLAAMLGERGLEAHPSKTGYIVCGSKEYKGKVGKELEVMPLEFGGFMAARKGCDKYLGQMIHEDGLAIDKISIMPVICLIGFLRTAYYKPNDRFLQPICTLSFVSTKKYITPYHLSIFN